MTQPPAPLEALLSIARDLTASLAAADRYQRLLASVRRVVPYDAACLLSVDGDHLVPLAAHGLAPEAVARRYDRREHPRLDAILLASEPVVFAPDSPLPDPFDGYIAGDPTGAAHVHACLGCALRDGDRVVGALTADALEPHAFDAIEPDWIAALGALAGAALHTSALIDALERRAERSHAVALALQRSAQQVSGGEILGAGDAMRTLLAEVELVARSDLPVLVLGETGTGKELIARRVHAESTRSDAALIHVNCAALPESIAESELFGHVAGSFTGASRDRAGKFEIADGGTLFLDEVGELPLSVQPKLLRALQQGEVQRVGSDRAHRVDVRVIAATNRDLEDEVARGRFRADLYHRLAVYPLRVPPLRARREDIPLLAASFLAAQRRRLGAGPLRLGPSAIAALETADWPGNVRELENVISRAALRAGARAGDAVAVILDAEHLDLAPGRGSRDDARSPESRAPLDAPATPDGPPMSLRARTEEFQRQAILAAVARHDGTWAAAARELGMHRSNLHHLAKRLGVRPASSSSAEG